MNNRPIGIFDSGLGGLSIAKAIHQRLPHENLYYIADSLHTPYGDKSQAFIQQRSGELVQQLIQQDAKAVVVACNTATVSAITYLRKQFDIPIIGVEPGIKPAIEKTITGVIGVLATTQTVNSQSFLSLVEHYASDNVTVLLQACPGLVEQVERLQLNSKKVERLLKNYLLPLHNQPVDNLVLGCTHYPFLQPLIERIMGPNVAIINTSLAVAKQVQRRLQKESLEADALQLGQITFHNSLLDRFIDNKFSKLWGRI